MTSLDSSLGLDLQHATSSGGWPRCARDTLQERVSNYLPQEMNKALELYQLSGISVWKSTLASWMDAVHWHWCGLGIYNTDQGDTAISPHACRSYAYWNDACACARWQQGLVPRVWFEHLFPWATENLHEASLGHRNYIMLRAQIVVWSFFMRFIDLFPHIWHWPQGCLAACHHSTARAIYCRTHALQPQGQLRGESQCIKSLDASPTPRL